MRGYIKRSIEPILKKSVKEFPCVVITGPRQAGKTTLLKELFSKKYHYLSLETPDIRAAAINDPRGFLELYPAPIIFDEIQHAPELLYYIKEKIDQNRNTYGQFILTGSQNILLLKHVTETLAGRTAILKLLPLSYAESCDQSTKKFPWNFKKPPIQKKSSISLNQFWEDVLRGSFPELIEHPKKNSHLWHASYIQTYLERDVRGLRQIGDLTQFQMFLKAIVSRCGQLFQMTDVAKDIGVAVNTVKAWLGILEATYQVIILRPYFTNMGKRLVKTPKVYFTDTGLLCYLAGIKDVEHLISGPMGGHIVENFIFLELYKRISSQGIDPQVYFWRTSAGQEIDFLIEDQGEIIPIEVKSTSTPRPMMADSLESFLKIFQKKCSKGYLVHLGKSIVPLKSKIVALPFLDL